MGIRSEGMVLAAVEQEDGAGAVLARPMPPGTRLKEDISVHHGCFSQTQNR